MKKTKFQRITAFALATALLICGSVVSIGAASSGGDITEEIREMLNADSYAEYLAANGQIGVAQKTENGDVVISATENCVFEEGAVQTPINGETPKDSQTAHVETVEGQDVLYLPSRGKVTWTTNGFAGRTSLKYAVEIDYYSSMDPAAFGDRVEKSKATSIERIFEINGKVPFAEARYMTIPKIYRSSDSYGMIEDTEKIDAQALVNEAKAVGLEVEYPFVDSTTGKTYIRYKMPESWNDINSALVTDADKENATNTPIRFFVADIDGNEIRSTSSAVYMKQTYEFKDSNGFYQDPFQFVITPDANGNVSFSLEAVNEPIIISEIRFVCPEAPISYNDYINTVYQGVPAGTGQVKIESEYFSATSSQTIYPVSDSTSAVNSPTSTDAALLNTIGGDKWQTPGQWIEYTFTVPESGLYQLVPRFKQAILDGMYTSRILYLYSDATLPETEKGYYNGIPFAEAAMLHFDYSSDWQAKPLNDGTTEFEFYFAKGVTYTVRLEVSLGSMGAIVNTVQSSLNAINDDYLNILKLTGPNPDEFRDYKFRQVMPETVQDLSDQADILQEVVDELVKKAEVKSSMTATLEKVIRLLNTMYESDDEIAKNLEQLKTYIGSLGTWISDAKTQPLVMDYISVQPKGAELPRASANFWQALTHEILSFVKSFFRNYDRMGAMTEVPEDGQETVEVWLAYGRDQTQVIRGLINNDFTPKYQVPINLKLVAGGTLLPSILSGMGPDVYIGLGQGDVINYAIRGALLNIENMEGYKDTAKDFNDAAMFVMEIECAGAAGGTEEHKDCGRGQKHCYGLPETQAFSMMFVREDIMVDLEIDIDKLQTWDGIKEVIPVLQANNMQIGMHTDAKIFLYQQNGELFADNGMRINLDSNLALESFNTMCDMFTMYSFPYKYDFVNRFRTGEMPIGFAGYTATYNHLKVFATEIEGLWNFYPMPGYYDAELGYVNRQSVSTASAIVMITGCENLTGSWKFMQWHVGADCQVDYSNEMVAILGPSAKHGTANEAALESMPWTRDELIQLKAQFEQLASIPNYPGSYIIDRYTNFAFLEAYNDKADPTVAMQSYITTINKEITRKRAEFGLETLELGQTLAQKRLQEAETKLNEAKTSSSYNNSYDEVVNNVLELIAGYETEDFASLRVMAGVLNNLNAELFGAAVADMNEAANCLVEYEKSK